MSFVINLFFGQTAAQGHTELGARRYVTEQLFLAFPDGEYPWQVLRTGRAWRQLGLTVFFQSNWWRHGR